MSHPRTIQFVALLMCGVLLFVSGRFIPGINTGREALNMIGTESAVENTPPEYAFAIQAFGAFRGLLTDIAFIRAEQYKQAGRYYDAMQLASWICKLQPRFPSVWEFQSWNMAWNISVTTHTPEERWNWVYNGAKLIRDEGLRYNPRSVNLYRQLAWIFINKMGETLDDYHLAYKTNWAWRMHLLLGAPPDPLGEFGLDDSFERLTADLGKDDPLADAARQEYERRREDETGKAEELGLTRPADERDALLAELEEDESGESEADAGVLPHEVVQKAAYDRLKAIDDAARTLDELYERHPETRDTVTALLELGVHVSDEPLSEGEYWRADGLAFTFFARYRRLSDPPSTLAQIVRDAGDDEDADTLEQFDRIVGVREGTAAGQALLRFLQRKVLGEVYKLDTAHMAYLMEYFGPLDWRGVDAHGLYWVTQGIIAGGETVSKFGNDKTNTARLIFFALHHLTLRNQIVFEPYPEAIERSYLNLTPDLNFIEPMHRAYLNYGKWIDPQSGPGAGETYRTGHINFLTRSIQLLYLSGRIREARHYYDYLRETYTYHSGGAAAGGLNEHFAKPLRDYVVDTLYEALDTPKDTELAINGALLSAYDQLAWGNRKRYVTLVHWARRLHEKYMEEKSDLATIRLRLNPLPDMQADVLRIWLSRPSLSEKRTVYKARLWRNLRIVGHVYLLQRVYDDLIGGLTGECSRWGFDVARAFPEPQGMEEFRENRSRQGVEQREKTVETPAQAPG